MNSFIKTNSGQYIAFSAIVSAEKYDNLQTQVSCPLGKHLVLTADFFQMAGIVINKPKPARKKSTVKAK